MHGGELNVKEVQKGGNITYINVFTLKALMHYFHGKPKLIIGV